MTLAITQLASTLALGTFPGRAADEELQWVSVGTVTMSVGDPGEDEEIDDFDENDFDDDFDDDFEEEIEEDEFESADPFQLDE